MGNMDKKSGDDQSYSSGDMFAGKQIHTHKHTDRDADMFITLLCFYTRTE